MCRCALGVGLECGCAVFTVQVWSWSARAIDKMQNVVSPGKTVYAQSFEQVFAVQTVPKLI
jgi:hypothetical protein